MAAASQLFYSNQADGNSVHLNYDDVTLIATGFTVTVGSSARSAMSWFYKLKSRPSPVITPLSIGSLAVSQPFVVPIQGVRSTDFAGLPFIDFGIDFMGSASGPGIGAVVGPTPL